MANSKINRLMGVLILETIRPYFKHEHLISPFPVDIKAVILEQPFDPVIVLTDIAMRPKAVTFCGCYREFWQITLN